MAVIPTRAGGLRGERVTLRAAALDHWRSFLHRPIGLRGHVKPMPVYDVVDIRVVADIDADLAAFARAQYRARHHAVVSKGLDRLSGGEFQPHWRDPERVVRCTCGLRRSHHCCTKPNAPCGCPDKEIATINRARSRTLIRRHAHGDVSRPKGTKTRRSRSRNDGAELGFVPSFRAEEH